jgi:hypothetical protein
MVTNDLQVRVPRKPITQLRVEQCRQVVNKGLKELKDTHPPGKGIPRRGKAAKDFNFAVQRIQSMISRAASKADRRAARGGRAASAASDSHGDVERRLMANSVLPRPQFYDPLHGEVID